MVTFSHKDSNICSLVVSFNQSNSDCSKVIKIPGTTNYEAE